MERANSRARSTEVRANEREADLKDRVRLLEERLVLLTEPDAALFTEHVEEAQMEAESTKLTSGSIPNADSPEAAAARCVTLLVEVGLFHNNWRLSIGCCVIINILMEDRNVVLFHST